MKPNRTTRQKSLRLSADVIASIEDLAKVENRTFNNMCETLLKKSIKYKDLVLSLK